MAPAKKAHKFGVTIILVLLALLVPFWIGQAQFLLDPHLYDPDLFTLFGFYRYHDPALFQDDYIAKYYSIAQWMPQGYEALQRVWASYADPAILHRWLPLVLWLSCLPSVWLAGKKCGGKAQAIAGCAIFAGSSIFIFRLNGGLAHSFAFPIMWWLVAAQLHGRPYHMAACAIVSALFYPVIAPIAGLTLALWLLVPKLYPIGVCDTHRADHALYHAPIYKKILWLMVPGAMTLWFIAPMLLPQETRAYGSMIDVLREAEAFPEVTHGFAIINPFIYVISPYVLQHSTRLGLEMGQFITLGTLLVLVCGILFHDTRKRPATALKPYLLSVALIFICSLLFAYGHAYRVAIYSFPVIATFYLPYIMRRMAVCVLPRAWQTGGFSCLVILYVAVIAHAQERASGYYLRLSQPQMETLAFVRTLPKDALFAGWPGDKYGKVVESIPYLAQRSVLLLWAGHAVAHKDYVLNLREKMFSIVDAYLASDVQPLIALRDRYHVDYFVVNVDDFSAEAPLSYIAPFNAHIVQLWERALGKSFYVLQIKAPALIYQNGPIRIIDLNKL